MKNQEHIDVEKPRHTKHYYHIINCPIVTQLELRHSGKTQVI